MTFGARSDHRRRPGEDFALAGVVGLADDALVLHPLDQRGGAVVADLQAALDVAGRGLAVAGDDGHGAVVEVVALAVPAAEAQLAALAVLVAAGGDLLEVLRLALVAQEPGHRLDLAVGDEG